jgi:hypothetical protein
MSAGRLICLIRRLLASSDVARSAPAICVSALGTLACTGTEPEPLPPSVTLIGKCVFTERASPQGIEAGEVFLYALRDNLDGNISVVTGTAARWDSLLDVIVRQSADILPARRIEPARLEFGGLSADRTGDAEHFVSAGDRPGEVFVSIGRTYGTRIAYPVCVFWE